MRDRNSRLVYSTGGDPLGGGEAARPDSARSRSGARLRLDRRASGRLVTVISGLPVPADAIARLLKELKTACGAGGTLKDDAVELQGDHRERVGAVLDARGIPWKRAGG